MADGFLLYSVRRHPSASDFNAVPAWMGAIQSSWEWPRSVRSRPFQHGPRSQSDPCSALMLLRTVVATRPLLLRLTLNSPPSTGNRPRRSSWFRANYLGNRQAPREAFLSSPGHIAGGGELVPFRMRLHLSCAPSRNSSHQGALQALQRARSMEMESSFGFFPAPLRRASFGIPYVRFSPADTPSVCPT